MKRSTIVTKASVCGVRITRQVSQCGAFVHSNMYRENKRYRIWDRKILLFAIHARKSYPIMLDRSQTYFNFKFVIDK